MTQSIRRYELRPAPLVFVSWLVGSYVGVIIAGATSDLAPNLFWGRAVVDHSRFPDGFAGWFRVTAILGIWVAQYPFIGFVLVVWPALAAILKWRPGWIGPRLFYVLGLLAGVAGGFVANLWSIAEELSAGVPFETVYPIILDALAFGLGVGVPAAIAFRLLALKSVPVPSSS